MIKPIQSTRPHPDGRAPRGTMTFTVESCTNPDGSGPAVVLQRPGGPARLTSLPPDVAAELLAFSGDDLVVRLATPEEIDAGEPLDQEPPADPVPPAWRTVAVAALAGLVTASGGLLYLFTK